MAIQPPKIVAKPKKLIDEEKLAELGRMRAQLPSRRATDDDMVAKPTAEGRARAEAELARQERARRDTAERDRNQAPGNALPKEDKGTPAGVTELGSMQARLEAERKAAADELKAGKAKALADASARAGLAGMGLSGGSAALASDIGRGQDRSAVLALAEIDRRHRDEEFDDVQRQAAIYDLEESSDRDVDGDGLVAGRPVDAKTGVGNGDPDDDEAQEPTSPTATREKQKADLKEKLNDELSSADLVWGDPDTEPGTREEPYIFEGNIRDLTAYLRGTGAWPLKTFEYNGRTVFKDAFGNWYILDRGDGVDASVGINPPGGS